MLTFKFRPWGELTWGLQHLDEKEWSFIGCVSTEDRCVAAFDLIRNVSILKNLSFFEIIDPIFHNEHRDRIDANRSKLTSIDGTIKDRIFSRSLLQQDVLLVNDIENLLEHSTPNLIIDISCLPKRYFFPMVKLAINNGKIENLLIAYTQPSRYHTSDLSEEPEPWYTLPLFMQTTFPEEAYDLAVVGTGFMPFSLPKLLKDKHSEISLRLLFPFPPGPPNYQRSWEFVRKIEKHYNFKVTDQIIRVNSLDVCDAFDHICSAADYGQARTLFAPYGPKPLSLAMCIYASLTNSPVYYTQPKYYNPNYSEGINESFGYCIKIRGENLYSLDI